MATFSDALASALRSYNDNGYAILRKFFHQGDVDMVYQECRDVFNTMFKQHDYPIKDEMLMKNMIQLFAIHPKEFYNCGKQIQHLISLHRMSMLPRVIELLHMVGGLSWPTICTRPVVFFNHPALAVKRLYHTVDAHQDWRSMQGSSNACVLWVPLIDCDKRLGALQVLPGSHKTGLRTTGIDDGFGMVTLSDQEKSKLIDLECRAGDAVLFHSMLIHQSGNNVTEQPRWSAHFRYNDLDDKMFISRGYVHPYIYKPIEELL